MRDREIPRGTIIGKVTGGKPLTEAEHFWKCEACGGYFDMRDLGAVLTRSPCRIRRAIRCSSVAGSSAQRRHASARWTRDNAPAKFEGAKGLCCRARRVALRHVPSFDAHTRPPEYYRP
jgi:hypothetical protein